jgi:hypothetical protein
MLGGLPKILDKNFVVGFFLPALLAILAAAWAFPSLGMLAPVRSLSAGDKPVGDLIYLVLAVFVLAIFLMTVNNTQYKMLEGYLPPVSWLLPLRWWHRFRFRRLQTKYDNKMKNWAAVIASGRTFTEKEESEISELRIRRQFYYPGSKDHLMFTKFGNIIRSFEDYPLEIYGADGVYVWPRLASVVSKDFMALHDDARSQVDCFVSVTHLALLISVVSLAALAFDVRFTLFPGRDAGSVDDIRNFLGDASLRHIMFAGGGVAVAILAYWRACVSAIAWGQIVRSAFDCYLPKLINQLGYAMPPKAKERKEFWTEFSRLISHGTPMRTEWAIAETTKKEEAGARNEEAGTGREEQQTGNDGRPAERPRHDQTTTLEAGADQIEASVAAK